jgi:putative phosphoribosyl transferase
MGTEFPENVIELPELRNRTRVFPGRAEAGRVLAGMTIALRGTSSAVLAIPAGGVAVGAALAQALSLPLDVAVVSKITLPWNTEAGYGAVAFDGTVLLNEGLLRALPLSEAEVAEGIAATRDKVRRRLAELRGSRPLPDLAGRTAVLVDDGLASGSTMRAAVQAVRATGADQVVVATPTGHGDTVRSISALVDRLYCANIRLGSRFAVADAYERWYDVSDAEVKAILAEAAAGP